MGLIKEYKDSLKSLDVEEILDLIIYRPISFLFVKLIYPTNLTPNQISIAAMLFGMLGGLMYMFGGYYYFVLAGISFFTCNVLDCADGQLARMKKNGTRIGRIIDGLIDYVTAISGFVGIGIAFANSIHFGPVFWFLVIAGGVSRGFQNMYFDYFRNLYMRYVYNKVEDVKREIEAYEKFRNDIGKTKGRYVIKFLVDIYVGYSKWQMRITKHLELDVSPEEYKKKNQFILRVWSWLGSTTHITALIIFTLLNRIDLYFWFTISVGNLILISLFIRQKAILKTIKKIN